MGIQTESSGFKCMQTQTEPPGVKSVTIQTFSGGFKSVQTQTEPKPPQTESKPPQTDEPKPPQTEMDKQNGINYYIRGCQHFTISVDM